MREREVPQVQRSGPTRLGAVICPSCGARRLHAGMLYCDQCGKRIPNSINKLEHSEAVEPREESQLIRTAARPAETGLSSRSSDEAGPSARVAGLSDSFAKSPPGTIVRGQGMHHASVDVPSSMLGGRQRVLGVSLVAFGVLIAVASMIVGAASLSGLGLASFLIGLLLVYLHSRPSFAPELVEASLLSSLGNVERILRELGPTTKAIYLKTIDRLDVPTVFLPMEENPAPPAGLNLSGEDRLLAIDSDSHRTGLLLEAPGASLLALMEKELGLNFIDLGNDDFLNAIRSGMVESLEIAADVKGAFTQDGVSFRIRDGSLRSMSGSIARLVPSVASRLGCPICSVAICAAVKVIKRDLILEGATHQAGVHSVTLRFSGGSTDEAS
jgi:hypothetical protein